MGHQHTCIGDGVLRRLAIFIVIAVCGITLSTGAIRAELLDTETITTVDPEAAIVDAEFLATLATDALLAAGMGAHIDFEGLTHDEVLFLQYSHLGIEFNANDIVTACSTLRVCDPSRNEDMVARTRTRPGQGEFPTNFYSFSFQQLSGNDAEGLPPLETIAFDIYPRGYGTEAEVTVEIHIYGGGVVSTSYTIPKDGDWHGISINLADLDPELPERGFGIVFISSVSGAGEEISRNHFLIDNIWFSSRITNGGVTPEFDPPEITVFNPNPDGSTVVDNVLDIELQAYDATGVSRVEMQISDPGGWPIWTDNLCGTVTARYSHCITGRMSDEVPIAFFTRSPGLYTLDVTACDNWANCSAERVTFTVPEAPPYIIYGVEHNQGLQTRVATGHDRSDGDYLTFGFSDLISPIRLLADKDLLLRFYLGRTGPDPVTVDGTLLRYRTAALGIWGRPSTWSPWEEIPGPNAGGATAGSGAFAEPNIVTTLEPVQLPAGNAARGALLSTQRHDLSSTLNYVIPNTSLRENRNTLLEIVLYQELFGIRYPLFTKRFTLRRAPVLSIGLIGITTEGSSTRLDYEEVRKNVVSGLTSYMPIRQSIPFDILARTTVPAIYNCSATLSHIDGLTLGDSGRELFPGTRFVRVGVSDDLIDCGGKAYLPGTSSITEPVPYTAAQEVGHNMGLEHASNDHGESTGGGFSLWHYTHGLMGEPVHHPAGADNIGIMFDQVTETSSPDLGNWVLHLFAACPEFDGATCITPDSERAHDYMSYGAGQLLAGGVRRISRITSSRWSSPQTWWSIEHAVASGENLTGYSSEPTASPSDTTPPVLTVDPTPVPAFILLIPLVLPADISNNNEPLPQSEPYALVLKKTVRAGDLTPPEQGDWRVVLQDALGNVLEERMIATNESTSHQGEGHAHEVRAVLPWHEGIALVTVYDQYGNVVFSRKASPSVPTVEVLYPNGGESVAPGDTIRWTAADKDGDPLSYVVQYSQDAGESWRTVNLIAPGGQMEAEFQAVGGVVASSTALIRVTAMDGLNASTDDSDGAFIVPYGSGKKSEGQGVEPPEVILPPNDGK